MLDGRNKKRDLHSRRSLKVQKTSPLLPDRIRLENAANGIVWDWRREEIPLPVLTLQCSQLAQLLGTADALRLGAHADDLREGQNRSHEPEILVIRVHRAHQLAVDLDSVDRKPVKIDEG